MWCVGLQAVHVGLDSAGGAPGLGMGLAWGPPGRPMTGIAGAGMAAAGAFPRCLWPTHIIGRPSRRLGAHDRSSPMVRGARSSVRPGSLDEACHRTWEAVTIRAGSCNHT